MDSTQIVLLVVILLYVGIRIRKFLNTKGITNYNATQVKQILKENRDVVLLDVRTHAERKAGAIKPSIHIPLHEITTSADQLKKYHAHEIICYCQSGSRSVSAAIKLKKIGFTASNLIGGYSAW